MVPQAVERGMQPLVDLAVDDLVARTGCGAEQVTLVRADPVTWPDRSMGCPVPGMRYEQVPVDVALIVLRLLAVEYRYHCGGRRSPFLCTTTG
jgi:hypothetical protein